MAANYLVGMLYVGTIICVLLTLWLPNRLTQEYIDYTSGEEEQVLGVLSIPIVSVESTQMNSIYPLESSSKSKSNGFMESMLINWMVSTNQDNSGGWRVYQLKFWGLNTGYCKSSGESMIIESCQFGETYEWATQECPSHDQDCENWATLAMVINAMCLLCVFLLVIGVIIQCICSLAPPLETHLLPTTPNHTLIHPLIASVACILQFFLLLLFLLAQPESIRRAHSESMFQPCDAYGPCNSLFGKYYDMFTNLHRKWSSPAFYSLNVSFAFSCLFVIFAWVHLYVHKKYAKCKTTAIYLEALPLDSTNDCPQLNSQRRSVLNQIIADWVDDDQMVQYVHSKSFNVTHPHLYNTKKCLRKTTKVIPGYGEEVLPVVNSTEQTRVASFPETSDQYKGEIHPFTEPFLDYIVHSFPSSVGYKKKAKHINAMLSEPGYLQLPPSLCKPITINGVQGMVFTCFNPTHTADAVHLNTFTNMGKTVYPSIPAIVGSMVFWQPYDILEYAQELGEVMIPKFPVSVHHQNYLPLFLNLKLLSNTPSNSHNTNNSTSSYNSHSRSSPDDLEMTVTYTVKPVMPDILYILTLPTSLSFSMFLPRNYKTLLETRNAGLIANVPIVPFTVIGILNSENINSINQTMNTNLNASIQNRDSSRMRNTKVMQSLSLTTDMNGTLNYSYKKVQKKKVSNTGKVMHARLTSLVGNIAETKATTDNFDALSETESDHTDNSASEEETQYP